MAKKSIVCAVESLSPTRYATRLQQADKKRGNDMLFMKEKNGKVPWKYEIKRYPWILRAH